MGQQITIDFDVPAQMRDGTILRANVYRPAGEGQWPVLLTRLPYGKDLPTATSVFDPAQVARRGYVVIIQDTRGRFTSEGTWDPFRNEALDGVDTVAWAAGLPYSNGSVGMYGASYFGFTQWISAVQHPAALKAIVPFITWNDPLNGVLFRGGALELGTSTSWQLSMGFDVLMRRYRQDPDPRHLGAALYTLVSEMDALGPRGYWDLPLKDFAPVKRSDAAPAFFEVFEHVMDRSNVEAFTIRGKHAQVTAPAFNIGGWYDVFLQDTIDNFNAIRSQGATPQARQSKLLIGPWTHGGVTNPIGEINFGFGASAALIDLKIDFMSLQLRWFDQFLKETNTGILDEAPIKIFVMGANIWRDEQEWPLARAVETRYYLHSDGQANSLHGDGLLTSSKPEVEPADQYTYDPANPVITRGGALLMTPEYRGGPIDQRPTEERADVLVYSTPTLEEDIEVTGPITVHLWAVSSAPDTDFVARLVDVHPNGFAQNLTDGIIRARYRNFAHGEASSLIEPGRAYEYEIDLWSTSNLFKKGHRIRLDITSSNFPRWDRNPNTGHALGADAELAVAQQHILHDEGHPSYILLPIVPPAQQ
ncbi:CocE/NonD family hydrolase [Ktedonosporobacter rubrisoli]|uniref:CocE/NonD family hydrolase n=2 Tax=Ktedonosporobacter rubrisoli TaxID=2509675 RepID=A0A4P6K5S0_KTERU|nr:CocE/NonD family hydrolase [Ktedonosporobacter rubrisoli]